MDQSKLIAEMEKHGIPETTSDQEYVETLVEVDEVEYGVVGKDAKFDFLVDTWEKGIAVIRIHYKLLDGDFKGYKFNKLQSLYTRSGKLKAYTGFEGENGEYVPASILGETIFRIKKYDAKQWNREPFMPEKLLGCKFKIGIRSSRSSDNEKSWIFAEFEQQIKKDKEYEQQQTSEEKQEESKSKKSQNKLPWE